MIKDLQIFIQHFILFHMSRIYIGGKKIPARRDTFAPRFTLYKDGEHKFLW